jgi:phosphatidylserine/phosphatidylglycerophosphate/cardiolipin synthase-like enzyme
MLNPHRRSGESDNQGARDALTEAGVEVRHSNPAFEVTHEKSMAIDGEHAFIESLNWTTEGVTETRDYAVVTPHSREIAELVECFEADWNEQDFDPGHISHLIWCPGHGRARIAEFIDTAKETLFVQNERYQDPVIIERLVRAARRGVKVRVMARAPHTLKEGKLVEGVSGLRILDDVGIDVRTLKHLKLHAKMIVADDEQAVIGSINLSPGSFDHRRELAIQVDDPHMMKRIRKTAHHDWGKSHKLDLTDEGLLADLQGKYGDVEDRLGLHTDEHHEH